MITASPARLYALVVGSALVAAGIVGFFYEATFTGDDSVRENVFGLLAVNGWHNLVHLVTGLLGLLAYRRAARHYAMALGLIYLVIAIWGFGLGAEGSLLGVIPVNTEDNVLHLLFGLLGLACGVFTPAEPDARRFYPAASPPA